MISMNKHILYIILSSHIVLAAQPYLGCVDNYAEGDFAYDVDEGSTCLATCTRQGFAYSFTNFGGQGDCGCGNLPALPLDYIDSGSTDSSCTSGYLAQRTSSQFDHLDCTGPNGEVFFDQTETSQFRTIQECFDNCQSYTFAVARPNPEIQYFSCFCGNDQGEFLYTPQVCDANSEYIYQVAGESPSEVVGRRRLNERRELIRQRKMAAAGMAPKCPKGLTACNVPGVQDAYECINTDVELESCGGCVHGRFGERLMGRCKGRGVDCTTLPGVSLGASTCYEGQCEIYACKKGWYWKNGACVKK
ncbi:hypothetical protein I204_08371 [Kwoniella mangroviensis CBS 8886]|uniref:uncharacterized protein n=1 Tax=Kwoniella mangroviensis CBS 8507 TaxID=1296122 RepID=UPI00080D29C4|nr:uncharacterized protein I203_01472 [Kwoniella mangroviensis CBS 8507]OCF69608.1 hypothetical protein I203_01472 [Kwoniella mangroviensis CBS 8507]OCF70936.1 hypothetical protein I204_08371 [Kwoniella mangroviensis CBS 8886]